MGFFLIIPLSNHDGMVYVKGQVQAGRGFDQCIYGKCRCPWQGGGSWVTFMVPSNPNHSVDSLILRAAFHCFSFIDLQLLRLEM